MYSTPHLVSDTLPPSQVGPGGGYHIYIYIYIYILNRSICVFVAYFGWNTFHESWIRSKIKLISKKNTIPVSLMEKISSKITERALSFGVASSKKKHKPAERDGFGGWKYGTFFPISAKESSSFPKPLFFAVEMEGKKQMADHLGIQKGSVAVFRKCITVICLMKKKVNKFQSRILMSQPNQIPYPPGHSHWHNPTRPPITMTFLSFASKVLGSVP